jgi:outer membrane protein, multidrug efflux system
MSRAVLRVVSARTLGASGFSRTFMRGLSAVLLALFASACALGPAYKRPVAEVPVALGDRPAQAASLADLKWWEVFQDEDLQRLIRTAIERNYDARIAAEQIEVARAQLGISRAAQLPEVAGAASYNGGKSATSATSTDLAPLTANVSYQVDLFGSLRRSSEAARAQLLATEEARRVVVMTLVSDLAIDYFQLLALDLQLRIANDTLQSQQESLRLTELRVEHGVATRADVLQAQQVLDAANAQIPSIERQIGRLEHAICYLEGVLPGPVPRRTPLGDQRIAPEVPPGLPSALLERRPDIRRAEQQLVYYNAQIGVAKAAYFPKVALTGSFGVSDTVMGLLNGATSVWTYTAALLQPIFNGGAVRSRVKISEAQQRQALLVYMRTVQGAFSEVSSALVDYRKFRELRLRQQESVDHLDEAARLSLTRYRGGVTTYLEVLDHQRSLFAAQLALAQARGYEYQAVVALYRALGGGWQS